MEITFQAPTEIPYKTQFIDGEYLPAENRKLDDVIDPSTENVTAQVQQSTPEGKLESYSRVSSSILSIGPRPPISPLFTSVLLFV